MEPQHETGEINVDEVVRAVHEDRSLHQLGEEMRGAQSSRPDPRWQYLLEGVRALESTVDIISASGQTVIPEGLPLNIDELRDLRSRPSREVIATVGERIQGKIDHYNGETRPERQTDARSQANQWAVRREGYLFGLRSLGFDIDSKASVVRGGARLSTPILRNQAVGNLRDNLPAISV